eukprot:CAMPEP_0181299154 /NCGR_PEP_ID=MMETSP1101-20121128/6182_1 /TAXON_ID=46948 /ORGANISM="Rhodomonas abbreviata, Strain Caron Lab Isolate" /LENGTH=62 /DNA_ID=CAMNT_0023404259 /DNA_START=163 /DNA_END=348 /DNA_ORIENTATION=+
MDPLDGNPATSSQPHGTGNSGHPQDSWLVMLNLIPPPSSFTKLKSVNYLGKAFVNLRPGGPQ